MKALRLFALVASVFARVAASLIVSALCVLLLGIISIAVSDLLGIIICLVSVTTAAATVAICTVATLISAGNAQFVSRTIWVVGALPIVSAPWWLRTAEENWTSSTNIPRQVLLCLMMSTLALAAYRVQRVYGKLSSPSKLSILSLCGLLAAAFSYVFVEYAVASIAIGVPVLCSYYMTTNLMRGFWRDVRGF